MNNPHKRKPVNLEQSLVNIMVDFLQDLKVLFPDSERVTELEFAKIMITSKKDKKDFAESLSRGIIDHKKAIIEKNRNAIKHLNLFKCDDNVKSKLEFFLNQLTKPGFLDEDEEEAVWKYLSKLLELSERYKKEK